MTSGRIVAAQNRGPHPLSARMRGDGGGVISLSHAVNNGDMICRACKEHRHDECRGGTWCDCQHQAPSDKTHEAEPPENWVRKG